MRLSTQTQAPRKQEELRESKSRAEEILGITFLIPGLCKAYTDFPQLFRSETKRLPDKSHLELPAQPAEKWMGHSKQVSC